MREEDICECFVVEVNGGVDWGMYRYILERR